VDEFLAGERKRGNWDDGVIVLESCIAWKKLVEGRVFAWAIIEYQ
jgi:hypothetical protein